MIDQIRFYLRHSINDMRVNGQRTLFALLCIGAGVAAIVSLQTLAVMIEATLAGNLQANNRGDIQFEAATGFEEDDEILQQGLDSGFLIAEDIGFFGQEFTEYHISADGFDQLSTWIEDHYPGQIDFTYRQPMTDVIGTFLGSGAGAAITAVEDGTQAPQLTPVVVDGSVYPYYSDITTIDGQPLSAVLQSDTDVVLSEGVADELGAVVGDVVRVSGGDTDFTVTGIVPNEAEIKDPFTDAFIALFGYYYLDLSATRHFPDVTPQANTVYLRLDESLDVAAVNDALLDDFPFIETTTTDDLSARYDIISENIGQLVTVMGLVSLLIGGIGIINTMQVIVRRRALEVAVLKTIGLQANQVTILFLVEAFLMGIIGSVVGIVLGLGATLILRVVTENILTTPLPFIIAAEPIVNGLMVGVLVTTIFGFMPTLSAGQVRPNIILRPTDNLVPRTGWLRTLVALLFIMLALSLVAQTVLGDFVTALLVTVGAFIAAGVLYLLLSLLIWLFGRFFPALGVVDLKISLRQMLASRQRAATTLLALVIGVFSLSLITLLADSISNLLEFSLTEATGGNVIISVQSASNVSDVEGILADLDGVNSYDVIQSYNLHLVSLTERDGTEIGLDELATRVESINEAYNDNPSGFGPPEDDTNYLEVLDLEVGTIAVYEPTDIADMENRTFTEGRQLTEADRGEQVMVVTESEVTRAAGIDVGDRLTFAFDDGGGLLGGLLGGGDDEPETITFEVVGVLAQQPLNFGFGSQNPVYALPNAFPEDRAPTSTSVAVDMTEEQIPALNRELADVPGTFALETAVLNEFVASLLDTFTAFPSMVAVLGLIVGGVVIANSVALTTMERRREIAVMKAVGLQRERVLAMLLLENGILGLIGGLLGVGIGLVVLVLFVAVASAPGSTLPIGTALVLMALCIGVALVAALSTAWSASGEKPLNVLRYE